MKIYSLNEVLQAAQTYPADKPMVYFLLDKNDVIYVGQASCLASAWSRIKHHRKSGRHFKKFDRFAWFSIDGDPNTVEAVNIVEYNPRHNFQLPQQEVWKSIGTLARDAGMTIGKLRKHLHRNGVSPTKFQQFYTVKDVINTFS